MWYNVKCTGNWYVTLLSQWCNTRKLGSDAVPIEFSESHLHCKPETEQITPQQLTHLDMVFPEFHQKFSKNSLQIPQNVFKITSVLSLKFPSEVLKFSWKLHKNSTKMCRKFILKIISYFFETIF